MIDITLLRMMKHRQQFEQLYSIVNKEVLADTTKQLMEDYKSFFNDFPDVSTIERDSFSLWFKQFRHPNLTADNWRVYEQVIQSITQEVPQDMQEGIRHKLVAHKAALDITKMIESWNNGDEFDIQSRLRELSERLDHEMDKKVRTPWVQDNIGDLLQDSISGRGFKWRQPSLNISMRPLIGGDFLIVAARPDVGKTTLLTDALSNFAAQLPEVYGTEAQNRPILWFNNEGPGKRIKTRLYQSALNAKWSDLREKLSAGTLESEFISATGGFPDSIRIFDVHDYWNYEIDDILRATTPGLVVFDMLDNIKFGGMAANNGQRSDQLLEAMYQWGRVLAVKHDCPVIATSQVSADGENMQYPLLGMLKDSKTGKQGAADAIITVGYQVDSPEVRYLGTTKNKLAVEGAPKRLASKMIFDGHRGRYVEPSFVEESPPSEQAQSDPTAGQV